MLSELCKELRNWFNYNQPKWVGDITISEGSLVGFDDKLQEGQYFRVVGSVFNDGVYSHPHEFEKDEEFNGGIWAMAIPEEVVALSDEIDEWQEKYGAADSANMSPFQSESFGGYSYSKGNADGTSGGSGSTWKTVFADKLARWRKI